MSLKGNSPTELAAVAPAAAKAPAREPDAIEYPDRPWTAPSVWHGDAVLLAMAALRNHFRDRQDVLVAWELVVYYEQGDNTAWLRPDVQVVFGVGREGNRHTFKVWEEGRPPDFVLELASPSTGENDARHKAQEYFGIGVREYWRLDPVGTMMGTALEGYRASGGRCHRVESVARAGGFAYLRSGVLGLDLRGEKRNGPTVLVIRDPRTGEEFDGELETSERKRRIAEDRVRAAKARRIIAEEKERVLEQRLRDLSGQTRPMGWDS